MILLEACLAAPLTAVSRRWPGTLHAADMATIVAAWPDGTVTAPCGAARLRLLAGHDQTPTLWPPAARSLPPGFTRCHTCWIATGKKRPRTKLVPRPGRDPPPPA